MKTELCSYKMVAWHTRAEHSETLLHPHIMQAEARKGRETDEHCKAFRTGDILSSWRCPKGNGIYCRLSSRMGV